MVEAHRLVVQQAGVEGGSMVQLEPGGLVAGAGKGGRVRLGEPELGKGRQLRKDLLRDRQGDFVAKTAREKAFANRVHLTVGPVAAHRPAEAVGLAPGEASAVHRYLQDLFLVEDHSQRLL